MSIVRSPVRSCVRSPVQGVFGGSASLLEQATSALGNVAPYHWLDFVNNRALYAGADVGNVTGATGYSFTRASDGYYTNSDGTLTLFGSGALRRGDRGVLIEGSRTNLLVRSQEFDNASWSKIDVTTTANTTTAPDGTTTADSVIENTANAIHRTNQGQTVTLSQVATISVFVRPVGSRRLHVNADVIMGSSALFDFTGAGSVIATAGAAANRAASISALANGWFRVTVIGTGTGTANNVYFQIATTAHSTATDQTYTGDGTSGFALWGAQLEAAAFPSSYVPTVAASATRASDVLTYTAGVTYPLQLWSEFERAVDTGADETILQMRGSANERALMNGAIASTDVTQVLAVAGGVVTGSTSVTGAVPVLTVQKIAGRIAVDDFRSVRNGTLGTLDSSGAVPTAPTEMQIGHQNTSTPAFGYIRRIAVIQGAGTDANLIAMTS